MAFVRPLRVQYLHIHICIYAYMHILPPLTYALTNTSISSVSHLSLTLPCFYEPYMLFAVVNHRLNHYLQSGQQCVREITFILTAVCYFHAVYCIVLYCMIYYCIVLYSISPSNTTSFAASTLFTHPICTIYIPLPTWQYFLLYKKEQQHLVQK